MSPMDDLYAVGYPGGIFNTASPQVVVEERVHDAEAAPGGGQPWATAEIDAGDRTCLANQVLHPETLNINTLMTPTASRNPAIFDQRSPARWARTIDVPVFMVGALEDEQGAPSGPR